MDKLFEEGVPANTQPGWLNHHLIKQVEFNEIYTRQIRPGNKIATINNVALCDNKHGLC